MKECGSTPGDSHVSLTLYFLRHGQTAASRSNFFCGSMDPELTAEGQEMAREFANTYKGLKWAAIFCSPMKRTQATARPLCEAVGMEPQLRDGLKEINYGQWEGKSVEEVEQKFHDDHIKWLADPGWNSPTDGEPAVAIAHRLGVVLEEIKRQYDSGNVLLVSHKASIRIALCGVLGIDVGRFRYRLGCPVGSVSVVEFNRHGPLLKALADRIHLNERLRNLPGT
jgi:broad specificity phosphatase PhoE